MPRHAGRLPDALRRRLERSFGADLSEVRLHRCGTARRITEDLGTTACAVDGAILLGADVPDVVLAHEVAHLLQARRPGAGSVAAAEEEAHRLAARALAGLPCRVVVPADGALPLRWEEAGHYYTVYFIALACGVTNDEAMRIAFWTQFPDELSELDAVKAGINIGLVALENDINAADRFMDMFGTSPIPPAYRHPVERDLMINLDVQMGLHCLTGANCEEESNKRERISLKAGLGDEDPLFAFGMSLHSFGDSYAHRNPNTNCMYPPVIGHMIPSLAGKNGGELARAANLHHPDGLTPDRGKDYEQYVRRLYRLINFRMKDRSGVTALKIDDAAEELMSILDKDADPLAQIAKIRMATKLRIKTDMHRYQPELQEDMYHNDFDRFAEDQKKVEALPIAASKAHVKAGLRLAHIWAQGG